MLKNKLNHNKNKGFSLIEILISILISSVVLISFYQISFSAVKFFSATKNQSDNLETKTPSMELLARYFERCGANVVTDASDNTFPSQAKKILIDNAAVLANGKKITFYANLGGMGFVKSISGSTANLISCRFNDKLIKANATTGCYYVRRGNQIFPANTSDHNSISFNSFSLTGSECVEDNFTTANTNSTVNRSCTVMNNNNPNITTFELQEGDVIFGTPHKVELYIDNNALDKNKKWLFVKLTPLSSKCGANIMTDPIAPANKLEAEYVKDSSNNDILTLVKVSVEFRSKEYKKQINTFKVTRVFGDRE